MKKITHNRGSSLLEVMIAAGIMVLVFAGLLQVFLQSSVLSDMTGDMTLAVNEAQSKMEEIRNHEFDDILTDYGSSGTPGNTFATTLVDGMGAIYITPLNSDLYEVDVVVSWQEKNGRVIGEDLNVNGTLNAGEDANSNGKLDSVAAISSYVTRRL